MVNGNIQDEVQAIKNDINQIRADVQLLIEELKKEGLRKVGETRSHLEDELDEQKERLRASLNRARDCGLGTVDDLERHVNDHPLGSLLTAFGIGYLLARLSGK